ncbi:MAG: choice-of-anchor D domain-containing protein [Terriglobales bacterium]
MTIKRGVVTTVLTLFCLALPAFTQNTTNVVTKGPIVTRDAKHVTGPLLREIAPLLPEFNVPPFHEIENGENPNWQEWSKRPFQPDPALQTRENSPSGETPSAGLEFDALGYTDSFFCNCMPADNDGAPGIDQYTEFVNTFYGVYNKSGSLLLGPLAGNTFWSALGGGCAADNWGDPMVRFDAAAQRWVVAQFDLGGGGSGPYAECVAVSTSDDATGSWNQYRFSFGQFPDYPKLGVWSDAYYFSYNLNGGSAEVCANDRNAMLAGSSATQVCFTPAGQFGMLPADLDGSNQPAPGTPNFFMELDPDGSANLSMWNFHVDFVTPSNSTFTGPTLIPIASYTPSCPGYTRGACAPQPDPGSDGLETLSDRLMYRLAYRNYGDHTVLTTSHSVQVNGTGAGVRWYEIHNPETGPTLYQQGTFSPDSQYRFMGAVAMDRNEDMAVGFTRTGAGAGQYPSLVYAGRVPSDTLGTLESEVTLLAGTGSQSSGGYDRWGDYSSMTVDPTDDCTFWFTESYIKTTGANSGFNWSTAIGNFSFAGCGTPDFALSANPNSLTVKQGSQGTSTVTVTDLAGFSGSVTLSNSTLPSGVTAAFNPNPTTNTSTLTFTAAANATTGTTTVTITGVSGSLTHTTTLSLSIIKPDFSLSANPNSVGVIQGHTGTSTITISPINGFNGAVTLSTGTLPSGVTAGFNPDPATSTSTLTFTAAANATTGTTTVTVTGVSGSLTHSTNITLTVTAPVGTISVKPATEKFAKTLVGQISAAKTVTATNTGSASVNFNSVTVGTANFKITSSACTGSLAPNKNCKVQVEFTPTQGGTVTDTLTFTDSASNNPQTVALSGTGEALLLNPTFLNFNTQAVGTTSAPLGVTITNESSSTVSLTGISLTGSAKGSFLINNSGTTCGASLGNGASCVVSVQFKPVAKGVVAATLQIKSTGGGSPQTVSLEGTGQ